MMLETRVNMVIKGMFVGSRSSVGGWRAAGALRRFWGAARALPGALPGRCWGPAGCGLLLPYCCNAQDCESDAQVPWQPNPETNLRGKSPVP